MKKPLFRLLALCAALACLLGAAPGEPGEGEQYDRLAHPVAGADARQVVELFWYDCPDSHEIEQPLADWAARQKPRVKVLRIPAVWPDKPDMVAYARLYYTLDRLGVAQREAMAVFRAVRDEGQDLTTEENVLKWAAGQGLDVDAVRTAYASQKVTDAVEAAPALRERYQVSEQPSVVVGGRFHTAPSQAGGAAETVRVLDHLYRTAG
jgi:protein dithiol oxidoreductase (disulfide-forming)